MTVLHASMFGHTSVLGEAVAEGARQVEGADVIFKSVDDVQDPIELTTADAIIWGSSGFFANPNPKMATFLSKLGGLFFTGALQGKVGGVFATIATPHWGIENILRTLQSPMQAMGMTIVSNNLLEPEHRWHGCPYGASAIIPVEPSKDAPMNRPSDVELEIARNYGKQVAETAIRLTQPVHV